MFNRKYWNVLVVDDEPDVHDVTELMLKKEDFYGAKIKFHHAKSANEAIEMLKQDPTLARAVVLAVVDVVMEDDQAGLRLCKFVRQDLGRHSMQLLLRTGQPGQAPPRKIIDTYNISGYLTKLEASGDDRLYMAVKTAILHYYETTISENFALTLDSLRERAKTPSEFLNLIEKTVQQNFGAGNTYDAAYEFFGGEHYAGGGCFKDKAAFDAIKGRLFDAAAKDLETARATAPYSSDNWSEVPLRAARVDNYVIVQTPTIGTNKLSTLVMKDPSYPKEAFQYYVPLWRQHLAYFAQALMAKG